MPIRREGPGDPIYTKVAEIPVSVRLQIPYHKRPNDKTNWCWVACTKMVLEGWKLKDPSAKPVPKQCGLASCYFKKDCCLVGCEDGMPLDAFEPFLRKYRP